MCIFHCPASRTRRPKHTRRHCRRASTASIPTRWAAAAPAATFGMLRWRGRRTPRKSTSPPLTPPQITSLGVVLIAAQLPQALHLPIWVAAFGLALVVLRFILLRRDRAQPFAAPAR